MILPSGLTFRPEFQPQHDDGNEGRPSKAAPGTTPAPSKTGEQAEKADGGAKGKQPGFSEMCSGPQAIMLGGMLLIFYFLLIRPQNKREKEMREMRAALKKGDEVVTASGMHAIVVSVDTNVVSVRPSADGPIMRFDASSIGRVLVDEAAKTPAENNKAS